MTLNVHYVPENKTWPQGTCHKLTVTDSGVVAYATRKTLVYGSQVPREELKRLLTGAGCKDVTFYVNGSSEEWTIENVMVDHTKDDGTDCVVFM